MENYSIPKYQRVNIPLTAAGEYKNPFKETEVYADFTFTDGTVIRQLGFWKGGSDWCIRFAPIKEGVWTFKTVSTDAGLNNVEGTITCTESQMRHDIDKHGWVTLKEDTRYFVHEDGTPFFWLGDTHWQGPDYERIHQCNYPGCTCGNQFKHLVDDRVKKGFTVYQTYFSTGRNGSEPEKEVLPWWSEPYEIINTEAFEKTDYMFEYLDTVGLEIGLGVGLHSQTYNQMKGNEEALFLITKYIVARYSAYPIIWLTGQEIICSHQPSIDLWLKVGDLIGKLDGYQHPRGAHMYPWDANHPSIKPLEDQPWHQYYMLQAGHGAAARWKTRHFYESYYNVPSKKIYIEGECQYEDIYYLLQNDASHSRKGAWQAMLSGASGFTYGVTGVWALTWACYEKSPFDSYNPEPWYIGMDKHGSLELQYMKEFLTRFPFWKLEPIFGDIGCFEERKFACAAKMGDEAMIWYFLDENIDGGMLRKLLPETKYFGYWFDVITGKYISIGEFTTDGAGQAVLPNRPSIRDWVFVATRTELTDIVYEEAPYYNPPKNLTADVLGKRVFVTKIKSSSFNKEHPIANVLDGQDDTYWQPYSDVTCQTIDMELDEAIDGGYLHMKVLNKEYRWYNLRIWGSNDGENYDLITDVSGGWANSFVTVDGAFSKYIEYKGAYKHLRFYIESNLYKTPIQVSKLEVYTKK